jgi:hypothetical protein
MEKKAFWLIGTLGILIIGLFVVGVVLAEKDPTQATNPKLAQVENSETQPIVEAAVEVPQTPELIKMTHIETPTAVRALYMSSWVASTTNIRDKIIDLIDTTNINAVVIDIKDYTGKISFEIPSEYLKKFDPFEKRIIDVQEFIGLLHSKGL